MFPIQGTKMTIEIKSEGRRHYIVGNTFAIKDQLRSAGAKWDADRRAWWTGKREVAEQFIGATGASSDAAPDSRPAGESIADNTTIAGKAQYQGKEYLLLWSGQTKRGIAAKLAFPDGSRVFWAELDQVRVTKTYQDREYRGRREPGMTFGRLRGLREQFAAEKQEERQLGAKNGLVGKRSELCADFTGSKHNRKPNESIGDSQWLKHNGERIAVVLVGFELASYLRSDDAEDMGHYGVKSGYYGVKYFRPATLDEYQALQVRAPREDAVSP